jgi:transcriptional regulator with PAS, ATPase and Fis domain
MKIAVSWIGVRKDFNAGKVAEQSPNYLLHKADGYDFDKHIILYNKEAHHLPARLFQQEIIKKFPKHEVEIKELSLIDERDLNEVQNKVGAFIRSLEEHDVRILISTGTSILKIAWYVFSSSYQQHIKLIQYRANHGDFGEVDVVKAAEPYTLVMNEQSVLNRKAPAQIKHFFLPQSIQPLYDRASRIALVDNTVLIIGDTGTGKEHLANYIHKNSPRKEHPFLVVNCSSFNDEMLSSELFGHVKGSFTGSTGNRTGIFEQAFKGTVFLDEIGDISPFMQQSLLRVLQEKKIQRLGDAGRDISVNVRVIAATNKNLLEKVTEGKFREDLYYRLAVSELEISPLREWPPRDKKDLIEFLVRKKALELGVSQIVLSESVKIILMNYLFPGNIRELENLIAGLYPFRTTSLIQIADLPRRVREDKLTSLRWEVVESEHIRRVLRLVEGNQSEACKQIGYAVNTFKARLKQYNINIEDFKA